MAVEERRNGWGGRREGAGRPRLPESERGNSESFWLPAWLVAQLNAEAQRQGLSRSKLVESILARSLRRRRRPSPGAS